MFVGLSKSNKEELGKEPLFVSDCGPLLIGRGIFELLLAKGLPLIEFESLDDIEFGADDKAVLVKAGTLCFVGQIFDKMTVLNKRIYILCEDIGEYESCHLFSKESFISAEQTGHNQLAFDLTGVRKDEATTQQRRETPITPAEIKPVAEASPDTETIEFEIKRKIDWAELKKVLKKDGLNSLFALVFVFLGFATELGYFFLGHDSSQAFHVACIVMASAFPFMACIPMGFLFQDTGCKKPSDSLLFVVSLLTVFLTGLLCPIISLGLGNALAWNQRDLVLFTCLGLSTIVWTSLRLALAKPITKIFSKRTTQ